MSVESSFKFREGEKRWGEEKEKEKEKAKKRRTKSRETETDRQSKTCKGKFILERDIFAEALNES